MPIYLVRHAHAGSRALWEGEDVQRPLSARGRRQAEQVLALLCDRPLGRLFSSPAQRCTQTLEPLAELTGLPIETTDVLAEGSPPDIAEQFLLAHADEHPVVCSHGDVIPRVLRRLYAAGMRASADTIAAKGSTWVLDTDGSGTVVTGTYHPLPD